MIPPYVLKYLPFAALALGLFVIIAYVRAALRAGMRARPLLLAGVAIAALPAIYVGLTWSEVMHESYLRLARPWVTLALAAAAGFSAMRLVAMKRSTLVATPPPRVARSAGKRSHRDRSGSRANRSMWARSRPRSRGPSAPTP